MEDSTEFKIEKKIVPRHLINNIHHVVGMPDFLSDRERSKANSNGVLVFYFRWGFVENKDLDEIS